MITVADKTIKLQIWDTVCIQIQRQGNNLLSRSLEDTIGQQQEPSLFMTLQTGSPSTTSLAGSSRLK